MSTEQVNPSEEGSGSAGSSQTAAAHQSPAQTAFEALQEAESTPRAGDSEPAVGSESLAETRTASDSPETRAATQAQASPDSGAARDAGPGAQAAPVQEAGPDQGCATATEAETETTAEPAAETTAEAAPEAGDPETAQAATAQTEILEPETVERTVERVTPETEATAAKSQRPVAEVEAASAESTSESPVAVPAAEESADQTGEEQGAAESDASADQHDPFAVFSAVSATSLMFHAPDTEAIKAAAERAAQARDEARQAAIEEAEAAEEAEFEDPEPGAGVTSKRRRRRRRGSVDMELEGGNDDDPPGTVTRIRTGRVVDSSAPTTVQSVKGSTRLEAKKQRRRESRQSGRRRQVITEAEFLARRESVERKMVVREKDDRIQIGVLEDGVLAEHFVSHTQQDSLIGNVYLGKVQNVLPSMEAAFIDIGRGRNAVLYAGEVNWDDAELGGGGKRIENALKPGDPVLVQVTKDPVGHKGARLTSQVSLPGRYLVYVPGGSMTGISRKLPDVERQRLKKILKDHLPDGAGVIVRTAAEGASEQELTNDINRLRSQWEQIQEKSKKDKTLAPELLYAEPDLTIKTVRDVFNEDFTSMTVQGDAAWDNIEAYVMYVAPDLLDRVSQWSEDEDLFEHYKVDEQIYKALDRKVMLPSGGSLVIDRTEAMTVVDVNTGKFTGSGGNLEETVTKNNLEAAEEIVRQLRLRDIGGIIVIDFIDMVLEANRELVLRRLVECLGRDRTKHQVAEVTSLGLVQMTRKRMGTGLLEIFSEPCEACEARGVVIHDHPLKGKDGMTADSNRRDRNERKRNRRANTSSHGGSDQSGGQNQDNGNRAGKGGNEEDPEQAKRAEATRNAFAAIASASHHDDKSGSTEGSDADTRANEKAGKNTATDSGKDTGSGSSEESSTNGNGSGRKREPSGDRNGRRGRGRAAADTGADRAGESGAAQTKEASAQEPAAHGQQDSEGQDGGRDGGKRRRKRRGKRSRNRGQNDAGQLNSNDSDLGEYSAEDRDVPGNDPREQSAPQSDAAGDRGESGGHPASNKPARGADNVRDGRRADDVSDGDVPQSEGAHGLPTAEPAQDRAGAGRCRSRGARRAAAPVSAPEAAAASPSQGVNVTSGTASVLPRATAANGSNSDGTDSDGSHVTINGQVIDLPRGGSGTEGRTGGSGTGPLDSLADSLGERAPGEAAPRRKRRSRRASAPTSAPGTGSAPGSPGPTSNGE